MAATRTISKGIRSSPITRAEFANALGRVLGSSQTTQRHGHQTPTVGLAISGGVDSMALAALCSRTNEESIKRAYLAQVDEASSYLRNFTFHAFVVDHGVRIGSEVEAEAVKKALERRGIQTQILKMAWPGHVSPAELPNFESLARKYRFQLLGKACKALQINSLLLAHHEDDNAETIMMRLILGHGSQGLLGIKASIAIPECYGMYGIHESGDIRPGFYNSESGTRRRGHGLDEFPWNDQGVKQQLPVMMGGVRVYRPLLSMSKSRLIATCQAENMEWFEDQTNKDPTITMRNAVRYMYANHSVPVALTKPKILEISRKLNERKDRRQEIIKTWLAHCDITSFSTCTGTLRIRFPDSNLLRKPVYGRPPGEVGLIAAEFLARIIALVDAKDHVEVSSLHNVVGHVFPELFKSEDSSTPSTAFTASRVYFQPVMGEDSVKHPRKNAEGKQTWQGEWLLSRQPYHRNSHPSEIVILPTETDSWTPWTLYDERYWLRVQNLSGEALHIKPLPEVLIRSFRRAIGPRQRRELKLWLDGHAPGGARWTLPAIVRRRVNGDEEVLALPTLGFTILQVKDMLNFEARYKKIDTSNLAMNRALP